MMRIPLGVAFQTSMPGVSIDTRNLGPEPLVKRCHNGCGRQISGNKILCLKCREGWQTAATKEQYVQA